MPLTDLVVLFIVALHPKWDPSYCPTVDMRQDLCRARQEAGYANAQLMAPIFVAEAERQDLGPTGAFWLASTAEKENSLLPGDYCKVTLAKDTFTTVTDLDPSPAGERRARLCIPPAPGHTRDRCRNALVLEETETDYQLNYCMAGEVGAFQLTRFEAVAGTVVPATGERLPDGFRERRERLLDPVVNTSIAAASLARLRDHCCGDNEECRESWNWVGVFNTGSCTSLTSSAYAERVQAYYREGLDYICSQSPDETFCADPQVDAEQPS